uniref:Protein TAPT1 homolog n=1 Tax=Haptolina brevifila TaxID=156173 RepID=A0A7S2G4J5_9EUKA|mmetsp:Transcript_26693/g.53609  ORF Transcript_26693/g.53609 Transcript_26693/m.53609 type:complete len:493 (+) Transcript_26693:102-1580(+)
MPNGKGVGSCDTPRTGDKAGASCCSPARRRSTAPTSAASMPVLHSMPDCPPESLKPPATGAPSFSSFIAKQLGWEGYTDEQANTDDADIAQRRATVYNFLQVPWNLEPLLGFGYITCLDCFLQMVTFLPLRVLGAVIKLACRRRLSRTQLCDMLRSLLIVCVSLFLQRLLPDMSHTYHSVRNQATLKLYVIFNLLEVFDKLCASFGQDILEAFFDSASQPRRWRGELPFTFIIALIYVLLHTMVLFYHAVALNIALNSHNNMLITLLISNNFVELKSNVFKKCEKQNLFQVACSDVVERFQVSIYLSIVALQSIFVQKDALSNSELNELGISFAMIVASEFTVDWIKHAFIIKFNRISPTVYGAFLRILCADACRPAGDDNRPRSPTTRPTWGSPSEHSAPVASRMGFVPVPLLCLVLRVLGHDVLPRIYFGHPSGWMLCLLIWLLFCFLKVLTSITLLGYACAASGPEEAPANDFLSGIERYTLFGKGVMS